MFIATVSKRAKIQKEPKCPLTDEWIQKMWYVYTMKYYSAIRRDEYLYSLCYTYPSLYTYSYP